MIAQAQTFALQGLSGIPVQVEVQVTGGQQGIYIIGLAGGAVKESRDRVRGAFHALGISLPDKRVTVNLSPADLTKDGSHYDLPIAAALLAAFGVVPADVLMGACLMGELGLDGSIRPVVGCLPAALQAAGMGCTSMIVPEANGPETAWAGADNGTHIGMAVWAPGHMMALIRHWRGEALLPVVIPKAQTTAPVHAGDIADIRGQEGAKRAAEIAAAGGHHLLMSGPPGSGKSMLASRLPGLLPPLTAAEALEVSMIHSVAGTLGSEGLVSTRPFRDPHHSASSVALTGGGLKAKPGEMSLAHRGVLFLDELPEFPRAVLETLRQPLETGSITIARASAHVTYPARFQLIAAMNPCPCGFLGDSTKGCKRQPGCGQDYTNRLSGPLLDRFDLRVSVPAVKAADLDLPPAKETTAHIAARVAAARERQRARFGTVFKDGTGPTCNAELQGALMDTFCQPDAEGRALMVRAAEKMGLSARGFHRVLRVARTLADLAGDETIAKPHVAEALAYRVL